MLDWCRARLLSFSKAGTGVLPSSRVMITVWESSGTVSSVFKAAAAANKELTPGIIS
jgi:hypothetical protein